MKLALFALACIAAYGILVARSVGKVDDFCAQVNIGTRAEELPRLAERFGVELRGPLEVPKGSGKYYARVTSEFTVGDYACRMNMDTKQVLDKRLGAR